MYLFSLFSLSAVGMKRKSNKNKRSQSKFVRIKWKPFDQRGNWEHCVNGFSDLPMFAKPNLGLVLNCVKRGAKVLIYKDTKCGKLGVSYPQKYNVDICVNKMF